MSATCRAAVALLMLVISATSCATAGGSWPPFEAFISNPAGSSSDQLTPRSLDLVFDVASLDRGNSSMNELLRGGNYLGVARHPYGRCEAPEMFNWHFGGEAGQSVGYFGGPTRVNAQYFSIQATDAWNRTMTVADDVRLIPAALRPVALWRPDTALVADDYPRPPCTFAPRSASVFCVHDCRLPDSSIAVRAALRPS